MTPVRVLVPSELEATQVAPLLIPPWGEPAGLESTTMSGLRAGAVNWIGVARPANTCFRSWSCVESIIVECDVGHSAIEKRTSLLREPM